MGERVLNIDETVEDLKVLGSEGIIKCYTQQIKLLMNELSNNFGKVLKRKPSNSKRILSNYQ